MRVRKKMLVWMLLLIAMVTSLTIVGIGSASDLPIISVDPPTIEDPMYLPGTEFTVDIDVDFVKKLWAYQFTLSYNPDVLHIVDVEHGPFLESFGGTAIVVPPEGPNFDNELGELYLFGAALYPIMYFPSGGSDQLGPLATVTFEVVGYGTSPIAVGVETGLANQYGDWIVHKVENPDNFEDGYFDNTFGPVDFQLWIEGPHGTAGGGAYPAWHVNLAGVNQVLYSKIANSGDEAVWVKVKFIVKWLEGEESEPYWSNEMQIPGVYRDPDTGKKVFPLVTLEAEFDPGPHGHYTVSAALYFMSGTLTEYVPYEPFESLFGGDGIGRDIATKFKVVEQM